MFNRYRRGLETCPQAKTSKNGHTIWSLFSDASERPVWLSAESKMLASTFGRFRLYRLIASGLFSFKRIVERSLWLVPKNLPLRAEKTVPIFYRLNLGNRIIREVSVSYSAPGNCSQVPSRVSPTLRLAKATLTLIPVMGMQNLLFILIPSQARSKSCKFSSDTMKFQKFYIAKLF